MAETLNDTPKTTTRRAKAKPDPDPETTPGPTGMDDLTPAERKLAEEIAKTYVGVGMVAGLKSIPVGTAIVTSSEDIAVAWVVYARANPKIKAALKKFTEASALGMLIMAHSGIMLTVMGEVRESRARETEQEPETVDPGMFAGWQPMDGAAPTV